MRAWRLLVTVGSGVAAACGSRSPLDVQETERADAERIPVEAAAGDAPPDSTSSSATDARDSQPGKDAGRDASAPVCVPGSASACTGPSGCSGTRYCLTDGTGFGACSCPVTCDGSVDAVYLISTTGSLYRFDPVSGLPFLIAPIACPLQPESMAVDRRGIAWVEDEAAQRLYNVSLRDGSCALTGFVFSPDFPRFGMSFVADSPGAQTEHLYVASDTGLGVIDPMTLTISLVGAWNSFPRGIAELAGTADARLYAFYGSTIAPNVAELDKATGAVLSYKPAMNMGLTSFAMAFWGGDLWLFTGAVASRYTIASGTTTIVNRNLGFDVVGAGSSTCAPAGPISPR